MILGDFLLFLRKRFNNSVACGQLLRGIIAFVVIVGFSACSSEQKEKEPGQVLVSVNGEEITILQLNDEMRRAGVQAGQHETASKQLLESLIARQLTLAEGVRKKLDRTPEVMQAIERAKAQIIAQAYLQSIVSKVATPSKSEIDEYFQKHPEFFTQRKQIDMTLLLIATQDLSSELKSTLDAAKSLDDVAVWLDGHNVKYARNQVSRTTADLPVEMAAKFREENKGQIFILNEQENSSLISVNAIKNSPVTAVAAAPQIERYLIKKKHNEAAEAEITRLRSSAKIEYLNAQAPVASAEEPAAIVDINLTEEVDEDGSIERGVKGLMLK